MTESTAIVLEVRGYRVRSLNRLLRGGYYLARAAERARELSNLKILLKAQNGPGLETLPKGPLRVQFTILYAGARPDVDGRWKIVGDALEGLWYGNDGQIESLTFRREKVAHRPEEGFRVEIEKLG